MDETKKTSDSRVSAVFEVTNVSSRTDRHPKVSKNRYYGIWKILYSVTLNPLREFYSLSNGTGYD